MQDIPRTVWVLGLVSLFMDISSELVHGLLPVLLVGQLGASMLTLGLIEGVAEATALIVKVFSGTLSDYFGKRKGLLLLGYGLGALSKPLFPLAGSAGAVFTARLLDRIGKGIRGAPRDALVADVTPAPLRGAAFGLRQSLDSVGAFVGPLLAVVLMLLFSNNIQLVMWFAVLPALVAVALIVFGVHEPVRSKPTGRLRGPISRDSLRRFPPAFWRVAVIGAVFTLARFSEAFLVLRAQQAGLAVTWLPLVMVLLALFYLLSAYPVGKYSDRVGRHGLLGIGLGLLILADLLLAVDGSLLWVLLGVALWGLHLGFTQGILAAMVADSAPAELRGTAFGVFNLLSGVAMLLASGLAGWLWQSFGAASCFYAGAGFAGLAWLLVAAAGQRRHK
ncbi:MAG: MFS transporter [Pseudomonas sp.]|uniref:MFS transporter n=1 Tax=Pseudomonas sp. TaxID=306 RepID=UPI0027324D61|nr:MFS transporter [Pseudomonas sp.]MDP3847026.1 MFS transporter [Pseudomonas sp.]